MWTRVNRTVFSPVRTFCSTGEDLDLVRPLLQLCADRHYVCPGEKNLDRFRAGLSCAYGPLGAELRGNLLRQWRVSMVRSRTQIFGVKTLCRGLEDEDTETSSSMRKNLLQGSMKQFIPSFELMNKKLPFGLVETGTCFQSVENLSGPAEFTEASLVWFCSPRTSSHWLDHWARQRLKWWRMFAVSPSAFSSSDVQEQDLEASSSRGIKISYDFPWGQEPVEMLWSRGDSELLEMHEGSRSKLQSREGRRSVPHVISVSGNMDRGLLAFMSNSLQQLQREETRQRLQQRKVLRLHPLLAPVKVALDISRGPTVELRRVSEGLLQEFVEAGVSAWPGYLDTVHTSLEQLNTKYDEMGVLFTAMMSENTLESGLLQVRNRDTTVRETMHISEVKNFISRFITAAENI